MKESRFLNLNIARRTVKNNGFTAEGEKRQLSPEEIEQGAIRLEELAVERAELGYLLYIETGKLKGDHGERQIGFEIIDGQLKAADFDSQLESTNTVSLEEEIEAIKKGEIARVFAKSVDLPERRLSERLFQVDEEINSLASSAEVVHQYDKNFAGHLELLIKVREVERLRRYKEGLEAQNRKLYIRRGRDGGIAISDGNLVEDNFRRIDAAHERIKQLEDAEVRSALRTRELLTYRNQLLRGGFAETPSVKKLVQTLEARVLSGEPVLLWGHTGTGKTEILLHLGKKLSDGKEPEIFSGSEEVTQYDLFGKQQLGPEGTYFQAGPAVRALKSGRPLLIDEVDLVPHSIIGRIQHFLTRRPGHKITIQENSTEAITVPEGFIVLATGNIRSKKYRREEMDPASLRRYWQCEVGYLPKEEVFDILLASLIDRRGNIPSVVVKRGEEATGSEDIAGKLAQLATAAEYVQAVFSGQKSDFMGEGSVASRGEGAGLEKATLSVGDLLDIVRMWKNENFSKPLEEYILSEFIQSQTVRTDQYNLVKIFILNGFFVHKKAEDFGIFGLTDDMVGAYRGLKG